MKIFKKIFKGIKKVVKSIGKGLKKGLAKVSKALGPVGMLALTLMMPALGGLWANFGGAAATGGFAAAAGTTAATTSGLLGSVFRGIAVAGNAIGSVYSSVTGMLGSVVKKIPIVGDVVTKVSSVTSDVLNQGRRAVGLPVSGGGVAATVDGYNAQVKEIQGVGAGPVKTIGADGVVSSVTETKTPSLLDATDDLKFRGPQTVQENIDSKSFAQMEGVGGGVRPVPTTTIELPKATAVEPSYNVAGIDVTESVKPEQLFPGESEATKMYTYYPNARTRIATVGKYDINTVALGDPQEMLYAKTTPEFRTAQNKLLTEAEYGANQVQVHTANATTGGTKDTTIVVDGIEVTKKGKVGTFNKNYSDMDASKYFVKRGAALGAAGEGLYRSVTASEEMTGGGGTFNPNLLMDTTITSATDYSSAYAGAFQGAGFVGPDEFNSYARAGYYGGDPYSMSQYKRIAPPQSNIRIGGV